MDFYHSRPFKAGMIIVIPDGTERNGSLIQEVYAERRAAGILRSRKQGNQFERWFVRPFGSMELEIHDLADGEVTFLGE